MAMQRDFIRSAFVFAGLSAGLLLSEPVLAQGGRGSGPGIQIQPGESCPPGTTEIRPRTCLAPQSSPPSIVDYRPRSTLVTPDGTQIISSGWKMRTRPATLLMKWRSRCSVMT